MKDKVGVLVSKGYGAGWSTWNDKDCALDQELVQAFENDLPYEQILLIAQKNWPTNYMGGLSGCEVVWVTKGTPFRITEYDGYESIEYAETLDWQIAQ